LVFRTGSLVFLKNPALDETDVIGTVVNVIPSDSGITDFTLYDVDFAFGIRTLHGSELRLVSTDFSPCDEKDFLFTEHKKAFDIYMRGVLELASTAGMMAHTEFEFLYNKVRAARDLLVQAREQLNEHSVKHGC